MIGGDHLRHFKKFNWPSQKHSHVESQHAPKHHPPPLPLPQPQFDGKQIPGNKLHLFLLKNSILLHPWEKNSAENEMRKGLNNRVEIGVYGCRYPSRHWASSRLLPASFSPPGSGREIGPQFGIIINSKRTCMEISLENLCVDCDPVHKGHLATGHLGKKGYSLDDWRGWGQMEIDEVFCLVVLNKMSQLMNL